MEVGLSPIVCDLHRGRASARGARATGVSYARATGGEVGSLESRKRRDQSFYQAALECRTIGQHWINIKAMIIARRNAGEAITIQRWAEQHAPVSVRWLNEYADFASRWNEFLETWRWSKDMPYSPERRAGLHTFLDLMLAKRRYDCVSRTRELNFGGRGGRVECPGKNSVPMSVTETSGNVETLTPTNRLICGDVAASLQRHVGDATVDVGIADPLIGCRATIVIRGPIKTKC